MCAKPAAAASNNPHCALQYLEKYCSSGCCYCLSALQLIHYYRHVDHQLLSYLGTTSCTPLYALPFHSLLLFTKHIFHLNVFNYSTFYFTLTILIKYNLIAFNRTLLVVPYLKAVAVQEGSTNVQLSVCLFSMCIFYKEEINLICFSFE